MSLSEDLAARRLHGKYLELRESKRLGGPDRLAELSDLAFRCFQESADTERVVAFVLAGIFDNLAQNQEDRPVTIVEVEYLWSVFDQPIIRCIDFLLRREPANASLDLLVSLVDSYHKMQTSEFR